MGAMENAPPPPLFEARPLGQLVTDSWLVYRAALPDLAATVAWGAVPAAAIAVGSAILTGIDGKEALRAAVDAGDYGRVGAASAMGLVSRFLGAMAGLAVYPVVAGHASGVTVSPEAAYTFVLERLWSLIKTLARQIAYILLGTLCFVIPGIILGFRYALSQPAVMIEGLSGSEALARSKQFMGLYPGKIVGNLIVAWVLTVIAVVACVFGLGLAEFACELMTPKAIHPALVAVQGVLGGYTDALVSAWVTAFMVLLYGDLMRATRHAA